MNMSLRLPPNPATAGQQWVTPAHMPAREQAAPRTVPPLPRRRVAAWAVTRRWPWLARRADNPFATLNKRLKRARFLDRQERVALRLKTLGAQKDMTRKPVSAWEIAQRPVPAAQEQLVSRPEPTRPATSTTFRPGYSRS